MRFRLALTLAVVATIAAGPAQAAPQVTVLVIYHSQTGNTKAMAQAVVGGVKKVKNAQAVLRSIDEVKSADLGRADGVILGSPTYFATMSGKMKLFLESIRVPLRNKVGGAFTTGGLVTGGRSGTLISFHTGMLAGGMIVVGPIIGPFGRIGASAVVPPKQKVGKEALGEAAALGKRVAEVAQRLKR